MKARRALVHDTLTGVLFIIAGAVAFVVASVNGEREFSVFAGVLAGSLACGLVFMVVTSLYQLRRARTLPEPAPVLPWHAVVVRALLSAAVPLGAIVYSSMSPGGATSALGTGCILVGLGYCSTAALALRKERRHGTRVFRADNGYFLAH